MEVLVVCTGNICRSPMAAGLLAERLRRDGVDATVTSAGLVTEDQPASKHGVTAMRKRAIDISGHRSRLMSSVMLASADLVLGMERRHLREAVVLVPDVFTRAFTMPELARRAQLIGPRRDDEPVGSWLVRAGAGRTPQQLIADDPADEVADPYGRSKREYLRTATELEGLVDVIVDHLRP